MRGWINTTSCIDVARTWLEYSKAGVLARDASGRDADGHIPRTEDNLHRLTTLRQENFNSVTCRRVGLARET